MFESVLIETVLLDLMVLKTRDRYEFGAFVETENVIFQLSLLVRMTEFGTPECPE